MAGPAPFPNQAPMYQPPVSQPMTAGGLLHAAPLSAVLEEERKAAQDAQAQPVITGLAGHIKSCWQDATTARQSTNVENRLLQNERARRGVYDPDKLQHIQAEGGSDIYSNLTSVKCRAASSWIRDVVVSTGVDRPWSIRPTPVPDLPPDIDEKIVASVGAELAQAMQSGVLVSDDDITAALLAAKEQVRDDAVAAARVRSARMADKMEDQLVQGGFLEAMDAFIDDLTTFPTAVLKGPVMRNKPQLTWTPDPKNPGKFTPTMVKQIVMEWERVSPFNIYPSPASVDIDDGYLIEKHRMSRNDLHQLIGVEGYDDGAIRLALEDYSPRGLLDESHTENAIASAEGKSTSQTSVNKDGLIDALQYWGSVPGQTLLDWGMDKDEVPDPIKEYHIEAWLVGDYVIKAELNYDPLCRKPYYKASYENVPGSFYGNSVCDLLRDTQQVANAASRAIVNNMGIASGPQVVINVSRLATGEDVTQLTPWRIWQVTDDPMGSAQAPITFHQPDSRIGELMSVFTMFNQMADEYSGIPKYMAGSSAGGAGRTASGMSMLMNNAGKAIKQVISNIDIGVMTPMLERLYDHNMQYSDDPDLKGDVQIVARGASSLVAKESAQMRRNEFLAATANPVDLQIVGVEGRHAILRETARNLDMDVDKVVPSLDVVRKRMAQATMSAQGPQGSPPAAGPGGEQLMDGTPTTDNYSPQGQ